MRSKGQYLDLSRHYAKESVNSRRSRIYEGLAVADRRAEAAALVLRWDQV
jgi:hypothetical protein